MGGSVSGKRPWVAVRDGHPVGFIELDPDGHIDCLYVHRDHQRKGVGTLLLQHAITEARRRGLSRVYAEVSVTGRSFFHAHGFSLARTQEVERNGQALTNHVMERFLEAG